MANDLGHRVDLPRPVLPRALQRRDRRAARCDARESGSNSSTCRAAVRTRSAAAPAAGRIWMDTSNESKRTSEQRIEEALALGVIRYFVTTCPKDYTMYTDAVKTLGCGSEIEVKDLIETGRRSHRTGTGRCGITRQIQRGATRCPNLKQRRPRRKSYAASPTSCVPSSGASRR